MRAAAAGIPSIGFSMENSPVSFSTAGKVGVVTLNRPEKENRVSREMVAGIARIRDEIGYGSDVSVLVLTAAGDGPFCAGVDPDACDRYTQGEAGVDGLQAAAVIGAIDRPVIAAVNGDALGQGLEIALACDLRIVCRSARFAMPQINDNDMPWDGGTQRLSRIVGRAKALEMILTGQILRADDALDMGLVSRVVEKQNLMTSAMEIAEDMAKKGPIALRYAKEAVLNGLDVTLEQGFRMEADLYFLLHTTHDRTEGIRAFQQKRKPEFKGT